jgi:hypothetical protein
VASFRVRDIAHVGWLPFVLTMGLLIALVSTAPKGSYSSSTKPSSTRLTAVLTDTPDWLTEINLYRTAAGLLPVTDQPSWDAGILDHLTYLLDTPSSYFTGSYASAHTENPASPYFTAAGAQEGAASNLEEGNTTGSDVHDIDEWFECPFHAVGMLRATLGQVAFASEGGDAGLDVISGLNEAPVATGPILFPGPRMTTDLTSYCGDESPSPLETCGWTDVEPTGLPLIALLQQSPSSQLTASLQGPDGSMMTTQNGQLCVVDVNTYTSTDPVYGPTGQELLSDDDAVFLIPRAALAAGSYSASVTQPSEPDIDWSFQVLPPPSITPTTLPQATVGAAYDTTLTASGGQPPYTWSLQSGALASGLTLSPSGTISGTPTAASGSAPGISVTDARGAASTAYLFLNVNPRITFNPGSWSVESGRYSVLPLSVSGGDYPYTYSIISGSLPSGMSLTGTGEIVGTPTGPGSWSAEIGVADSVGATSTGNVAITVSSSSGRTLPSGSSPPTAKTSPSPVPRISLGTTRITVSGRVAPVWVACVTATCQGTVKLTGSVKTKVRHGKKTVTTLKTVVLASGAYSLAKNQQETVELKLNANGYKLLADVARHPLHGALTLSVTGGTTTKSNVVVA